MVQKALPTEINSYDLLKTLAVLLMFVDHVGVYFFPETIEWRMVGRMCVPMWMFLIGYARSRDVSPRLWLGASLLVAADVVVGWPILSLNILFTILLVRLVLDRVVGWFEKSKEMRLVVVFGILVLLIPTMVVDYGVTGLALAMYGYYVRKYQEGQCSYSYLRGVMAFAFVTFMIGQQISFGFTSTQFALTGAGILLVTMALQSFSMCAFPALGQKMGAGILRLCGRYSLEIFVVHLLILKFTALMLGHEGMGWFVLRFVP